MSIKSRLLDLCNLDDPNESAQFPKNALFELSNACNHQCLFCYNSLMRRETGVLNLDLFKNIVTQAIDLGIEEIGLYSTGEPLLIKNLDDYVRFSKELGVKRVYITTNASLLTKDRARKLLTAGLDSIKISINGGDRETYFKVHGSDDWDKVIDNLKSLYNLKNSEFPNLEIFASCVTTSIDPNTLQKNHDAVDKFVDEIYYQEPHIQGGNMINVALALSTNKTGTNYSSLSSSNDISPCPIIWNRLHVTCEGYLTACCVDYENELVYADLNIHTLEDSWNNDLIRSLRRRHLCGSTVGTICHNCMTGESLPHAPISTISQHSEIPQSIQLKKSKKLESRMDSL